MSLSVNDYIKYDLYQVFLLNKTNFTLSLLRKAYQRQVLVYHPDKFTNDLSEDEKKEKMDTFLLINNAYTVLSNETMRAEYDTKREAYLNEEKGFDSLKSQFVADKKKNKVSQEEFDKQKADAELLFKKHMEEMNSEVEKLSININKDLSLPEEISPTVSLKSETVKPSDNFKNELSNITANRNIKIENTGVELYSGLGGSEINDKYAFINEAFSLK
jgi:curved DNA-binding protein CbpA